MYRRGFTTPWRFHLMESAPRSPASIPGRRGHLDRGSRARRCHTADERPGTASHTDLVARWDAPRVRAGAKRRRRDPCTAGDGRAGRNAAEQRRPVPVARRVDARRTIHPLFAARSGDPARHLGAAPRGRSHAQTVSEDPVSEFFSRPSPDGKWISYLAREGVAPDLYVQSFPANGEKYAVTNGRASFGGFLRNGQIAYALPGDPRIYVVDVTASSAPHQRSADRRDIAAGCDNRIARAGFLETARLGPRRAQRDRAADHRHQLDGDAAEALSRQNTRIDETLSRQLPRRSRTSEAICVDGPRKFVSLKIITAPSKTLIDEIRSLKPRGSDV